VVAIEILVKVVVVVRAILQQQWRRPHLSSFVASLNERRMFGRKADILAHPLVPPISLGREMRLIDSCSC
jgi:hypothetical protein